MGESLFLNLIEKFMPNLSNIIEKVNGKRNPNSYLFETCLKEVYSPTQTYDSSYYNNTRVSAGWVDINSPLPLMKRDSMSVQSNKLPIFGMKMAINEKQLNDLNIMQAQGNLTSEVVAKVLDDSAKCTYGIKERMELCFLQGLSEGVCGIPSEEGALMENPKQLRLDYGYLDANTYGVATAWSAVSTSTPISDISHVLEEAKVTPSYMWISKRNFNLMRQSDEVKQFVANFRGVFVSVGQALPVFSVEQTKEAFKSELGLEVEIIDRKVIVEHNGKQESIEPFNNNRAIFTTTRQLGALVYGSLPEETHKVPGVLYSKPVRYALLSKYSKNDPLAEYTQIKGVCAPIIENVDEIYILKTDEAESDAQTEGDAIFNYDGKIYTKSAVVTAYNALGVATLPSDVSDADLLKAINKLSKANKTALMTAIASAETTTSAPATTASL